MHTNPAARTVAAVQVGTYEYERVELGLRTAIAHVGGLEQYVMPGDRVLLKPNMLEGVPPKKAVTTHPEIMRALIRMVQEAGAVAVVGDSPGVSSTLKAAGKCGILAVCRSEGADLEAFDETVEIAHPQGRVVKKFTLAKQLTAVDKVISVAKMKTHTFMGITGATKNLFGFIVGMQKAQFHLRLQARQEFAGMLIDLAGAVRPVLSIVDGITGMEGNGPRNGKPLHAGVLLAGADCLAVDMTMAQMMGFRPEDIPLLALALERGVAPSLAAIERVGSARDTRHAFLPPRTLTSLEDRVPRWAARLGRSQLTARPDTASNCISCGRCVNHCPPQAMELTDGRVTIDYERCIRCYCCQELCPANAVMLSEGKLLKMLRPFL